MKKDDGDDRRATENRTLVSRTTTSGHKKTCGNFGAHIDRTLDWPLQARRSTAGTPSQRRRGSPVLRRKKLELLSRAQRKNPFTRYHPDGLEHCSLQGTQRLVFNSDQKASSYPAVLTLFHDVSYCLETLIAKQGPSIRSVAALRPFSEHHTNITPTPTPEGAVGSVVLPRDHAGCA